MGAWFIPGDDDFGGYSDGCDFTWDASGDSRCFLPWELIEVHED